MDNLIRQLFYFVSRNLNPLYLIVTIAALAEGLFILLFPTRLKRWLVSRPIFELRIFGGLIILLALVLIYLYLLILKPFFSAGF